MTTTMVTGTGTGAAMATMAMATVGMESEACAMQSSPPGPDSPPSPSSDGLIRAADARPVQAVQDSGSLHAWHAAKSQ